MTHIFCPLFDQLTMLFSRDHVGLRRAIHENPYGIDRSAIRYSGSSTAIMPNDVLVFCSPMYAETSGNGGRN